MNSNKIILFMLSVLCYNVSFSAEQEAKKLSEEVSKKADDDDKKKEQSVLASTNRQKRENSQSQLSAPKNPGQGYSRLSTPGAAQKNANLNRLTGKSRL